MKEQEQLPLEEGPAIEEGDLETGTASVVETPEPSGKVVRFHGYPFSVRQLTTEDWARAGVKMDTVTWDKENDFRVPIEVFDGVPPGVFEAYIERDPQFSVEDTER